MAPSRNDRTDSAEDIAALMEEILVDYGEDEQLWAFLQAFEDSVSLPADAFVVGEPVAITKIDYDGNVRRGLTASCREETGTKHVMALSDVVFSEDTEAARHVAAYRKWLGLEPLPKTASPVASREKHHKVADEDVDLSGPVKLIVLWIKEPTARCRIPGTERHITLRTARVGSLLPGEMVTVRPQKFWRYAGHPYLSGEIESHHIDVPLLGLTPLRLYERGMWNPAAEYWGEPNDFLSEWAVPIIACGPRPTFEMEQVLPGRTSSGTFDDPIMQSIELKEAGDLGEARRILTEVLSSELRCLDAHAHLGNMSFDVLPKDSIRHYEMGLRIGELSLGKDFDGLLPWGWIDNRPYLRCLHGYGLCLWRLERLREAEQIFQRMLWLNPSDNQGARFLLADLKSGKPWEAAYSKS